MEKTKIEDEDRWEVTCSASIKDSYSLLRPRPKYLLHQITVLVCYIFIELPFLIPNLEGLSIGQV